MRNSCCCNGDRHLSSATSDRGNRRFAPPLFRCQVEPEPGAPCRLKDLAVGSKSLRRLPSRRPWIWPSGPHRVHAKCPVPLYRGYDKVRQHGYGPVSFFAHKAALMSGLGTATPIHFDFGGIRAAVDGSDPNPAPSGGEGYWGAPVMFFADTEANPIKMEGVSQLRKPFLGVGDVSAGSL